MHWLLIVIIVLALFLVVKLATFRHKIFIIVVVVIVLFFYISFAVVARNQALDFKTASGIMEAGKIYFSWIGNAFSNLRTLTGNVIGMDWTEGGRNATDYNPKNIMKG